MIADLSGAARSVRRNFRFHAPLVLLLALAIAALTVVAAAARSLILEPPAFHRPDRLVLVSNRFGHDAGRRSPASAPELLDYRQRLTGLEALAAVNSFSAALTSEGGAAEQLQVGVTSGNFFELLGVRALHGRAYTAADDTPLDTRDSANTSVVVLGHGLWVRRFGADPGVVGRLVRVGGTPMRVLGVLPAAFRLRLPPGGMTTALDAWTPLRIDYANAPRDGRYLTLIGRIAEGRGLTQLSAEAEALSRRLRAELPDYERAGLTLGVEPLHEASVAHLRPILLLLGAAVGVVLALACINAAGMLLAQMVGRRRELAIRVAIGAAPARLLRQLGSEIVVIAACSMVLGAGLGVALLSLLRGGAFDPELDMLALPADLPTAAAALLLFGLVVAALALLGVLPGLHAAGALREGASHRTGMAGMGRGWRRVRGALVAGQVALSLLLVIGAGLLLRSSLALRDAPLGFTPAEVTTFRVALPFSRYRGPARWLQRYEELTRELGALPGVESVGVVDALPTTPAGTAPYARVPSDGTAWGTTSAIYRTASEGYFPALDVRVLAGRAFTAEDREGSPAVIVVDDAMARRLGPGSPLGRRLEVQVENFTAGYRVERIQAEVIGVVSAVPNDRPDRRDEGAIYLPLAQHPAWSVAVAMRTSLPATTVMESARRVLAELDPDLPAYDDRPMEDVVRSTFALTDLALSLVAGFALVALAVSAAGLFGLIAYVVRTTGRDQAVRMACGASPGMLLGAQVRDGLAVTAAGIAAGLLLAVPGVRVVEGFLVGVVAHDPVTLVLAAGVVTGTALVSTVWAAVGVLGVQPGRLLNGS